MLGPVLEKVAIGGLNHAKVDPDFVVLHDNPRFKAMIAAAEARVSQSGDAASRADAFTAR
jgi:hypothetical protein